VAAVKRALENAPAATHLFFVHHETTTGLLNPLEALSALCHERGIVSIVDAVSSLAGLPIDLSRAGADFLFSSSNKCVQGFAGLGFVLARKRALAATERLQRRNVYLNLFDNWAHQDSGGQFLFTPPVQIVYALNEALDEFFEEGQAGRTARYFACYDVLIAGMAALGLELLIPEPAHSKLLTTYLEPARPGYAFEAMHDYLFERDVTIYPGKLGDKNTFRIANIGAIEPADMQLYLRHLREYLAGLG
jgi:aspartate aminotransferase-like enzyme